MVESDAEWSGDVIDKKSTTGFYFKLIGRGVALNWGAGHCFSSLEAEYQGTAAAIKRAICLKQILKDFGIQQKRLIALGKDNQSGIKLCQNPLMHKKSQQIAIKIHFDCNQTDNKTNSIHYVPTDNMAADMFTKFLPVSKVETF